MPPISFLFPSIFATAEMRHTPHSTRIHYVISTTIQQILMSVSRGHFFLHGRIQVHPSSS